VELFLKFLLLFCQRDLGLFDRFFGPYPFTGVVASAPVHVSNRGQVMSLRRDTLGLIGGLEPHKIETRLIDERFPSVMSECVTSQSPVKQVRMFIMNR